MFITPASPKVSIIMPTYNRAKFIIEAIQSIRDQTYSNWQLIIVDDGSNDNTEELVAGLKEERIDFIKAGRIGIGGKIKNIGLQRVTGELISFLDSDDLWETTKLEKQIHALQQYPEAGFCLTGGYNFKTVGQPVDFFYEQRNGIKYDTLFMDYFRSKLPAFTQALLLRKECIALTGSFKEAKSFSDADFIINLARHFKAVIMYEPLVFRRLHDSNWIDLNWAKSYNEGIEIIEEHKKHLPVKIFEDALFRLYINFGENYLVRRERRKAIGKFINAWRYRPLSIVPIKKISKALAKPFSKT
jgi:glycosyltransferase involved in cell wall biosynthesis